MLDIMVKLLSKLGKCQHTTKAYSEKYDAYYCTLCKEWLDKNCQRETCVYCKERPERYVEDN
jgi:hypothetical protein